MNILKTRSALCGTAIALVFATQAHAETRIRLNDDKVAALTGECRTLAERVQAMDNQVADNIAQDVIDALNSDDEAICGDVVVTIGATPQTADARAEADAQVEASAEARAEAADTETVSVNKEIEIEGEALVRVPEPDVDVDVAPPQVTVRKGQPDVAITAAQSQIELHQEQPRVDVEIPEIRVRVSIPAPSVYVLSGEPDVTVSNPDPEIEVVQADPVVTVRQPDPKLAVDLGVDETVDGDAPASSTEVVDGDGEADMNRMVDNDREAAPTVEFVEVERQGRGFTFEAAQPEVSYASAEPVVNVTFAQQPTVEISQTGEPQITFETLEEREQRRADAGQAMTNDRDATQQSARQALVNDGEVEQTSQDEALMSDTEREVADAKETVTLGNTLTVARLKELEVVTADGEDMGAPEAFIRYGNEILMIVSEGGLFGIGDSEIGIPMSKVQLTGDQLLLSAMTEDDLEAAEDMDYDSENTMPDEATIELR